MMKNRCLNPKAQDYAYYGGRGVTVDAAWLEYDDFLAAMGQRPDGTSLERRDGSKGYDITNCKWATRTEQSRNREYTLDVTYGGRTQKTWEWAEELNIKLMSFHWRLWAFKTGAMTKNQVFTSNKRYKS